MSERMTDEGGREDRVKKTKYSDPRVPEDPNFSVECRHCKKVIVPSRALPKQVQLSSCEDCLHRQNMKALDKFRRGKS
jgi:hypothetical protein